MPLSLSLATPSDLPQLVRAQYTAFHPADTLHVLIYPSPDPVPEAVYQKTVDRLKEGWKDNCTWLKVVDDETGTVVAGAKWTLYPKKAEEGEKRFPESFGVDAVKEMRKEGQGNDGAEGENAGKGADDLEFVSWVMGEFIGRRRERIQGPGLLLDICYTHKEWQGKGAGKLLVKWGTDKADELGLKCFVEASYFGRPLYEKFGFVGTEHVLLRGGEMREEWKEYGEIRYYWMEREVGV